MIMDTERREAARRLRELPTDMHEVEELWEMKGLDTCCKDQTDYYLIHFALFGCFPADHMHPCDYEELHNRLADLIEPQPITGDTSDGYHTFDELYDHRAKLFSVIVRCFRDRAWKSKLHHDGTMYEGMFIVGVETPQGQATYHYDIDPYWDIFDCKELVCAPEWDGHTPEQAISRITSLRPTCDRDTPQKVAEEMFGKMRHSTKEEADAYEAMLKSKSVEIHSMDREALLKLADEIEFDGAGSLDDGDWCKPLLIEYARRICEALGE